MEVTKSQPADSRDRKAITCSRTISLHVVCPVKHLIVFLCLIFYLTAGCLLLCWNIKKGKDPVFITPKNVYRSSQEITALHVIMLYQFSQVSRDFSSYIWSLGDTRGALMSVSWYCCWNDSLESLQESRISLCRWISKTPRRSQAWNCYRNKPGVLKTILI